LSTARLDRTATARQIPEMVAYPDDRQRIERLMRVADVLARMARLVEPVLPRQVQPAVALGATVAEDIIVATERPATPLALIDGWAVRADATTDASAYAPCPLADAQPIDSGEAMPPGSDAVAPVESVALRAGVPEALAPVAPGDGVLHAGSDAGQREVLRRAGERLRTSDLAAMRALGLGSARVRRPRLLIGRARTHPDPIADAVVFWLAQAIAADGGEPLTAAAGAHMLALLSGPSADGFVIVGGTGSGRDDHAVTTLARVGSVEVHGVALSPGETTAFGIANSRPVLLLPSRLDAAVAAWLTVGRGMLARLRGGGDEEHGSTATLARKVASTVGLTEMVLVRRTEEGAVPLAAKYLPLSALGRADGYILIEAASEGYPAGATVAVRPLP
jgi:molybdopterin biosynthesis enzyme